MKPLLALTLGAVLGAAPITVSGRVTDDRGRAVRPYTVVSALAGSGAGWRVVNSGQTDAQGAYAIKDLPPGEYTIAAVGSTLPSSADDPDCAECCRPATDLATTYYAARLNRTRSDIDISMKRAAVYCVRGRITGQQDDVGLALSFLEHDGARGSGVRVANGRFLLTHLPPGRYKLTVTRGRTRISPVLAERTFEINNHNINLTINSSPRTP